MSESANERRRFQRIAFDAPPSSLRVSGNGRQLCTISLKGLLIKTPRDWNGDPNQPFEALIELGTKPR